MCIRRNRRQPEMDTVSKINDQMNNQLLLQSSYGAVQRREVMSQLRASLLSTRKKAQATRKSPQRCLCLLSRSTFKKNEEIDDDGDSHLFSRQDSQQYQDHNDSTTTMDKKSTALGERTFYTTKELAQLGRRSRATSIRETIFVFVVFRVQPQYKEAPKGLTIASC